MFNAFKSLKCLQKLFSFSDTYNSPGPGRIDSIRKSTFQSCPQEIRDDYFGKMFYNHPDLKVKISNIFFLK
jgi:hypothetical protein